MTIQAVLFDLDETLLDRTASLHLFVASQLKNYPALANIESKPFVHRFVELDQRGLNSKDKVYRQLLTEFGCSQLELADRMFLDYENNFWRTALPFAGMDELFHDLSIRGLKTGIITNGKTHIQLRSLLALNLDRHVDVFLISETENLRKPDPDIFLTAVERLGLVRSACVFVGDSPESDIVGAHKCGMKTIWFPNGAIWPTDLTVVRDAEVSMLAEIVRIVDEWT